MSSWVISPSGRRPQPNPNGGVQPLRSFRRPAPYPVREERTEDHNKDAESYEEVLDQQHYSGPMKYEGYQQNASDVYKPPADQRNTLYQRFYRQIQEARRAADCVVLSVSNQSTDYPKSLGQCLQERGLSVEMLYLQVESGLTRALQDVRGLGSPLCILVEQTNVALSSCTVIIFSESLKIHRNMPKEQAMDFVIAEYSRGLGERAQKDPTEMAARASELADDLLEREKMERHAVPAETRQLLLFLAEGVHLYSEELGTIAEYLRSRQDHSQATSSETEDGAHPERRKILPPGLGKPPPLLPTPSGPPPPQVAIGDHPQPTPLMAPPGSYPKTKPPPLLSMHRANHGPTAPHGPPAPRGPLPPRGSPLHCPSSRGPPPHHHGPPPSRGPPPPRGLLLQSGPPHSLMAPRGPMSPHPPRGAPPSLKSLHMGGPQPGLLPCPGMFPGCLRLLVLMAGLRLQL
ncbi:LOW QUALITY PROTEIN: nuclear receptor coactivator 5 [Hypomesus transpacificus]|uniref:LOW QUALITY PROTEIN: nuclear receptor coactivator 5 n=1 Tax=Hypomesus transpacificus TaxID=137520 RepID=UPI001F0748FD|nr:LOW QUALITY PROTEIN: nuclear receptor coactivator 5 [Hypomesus transpacificus]